MVAGDDVTLDTSGATGTFDTKDVGTGKTVTVTGLTLTGADAGELRPGRADDDREHHRRRR